MKTIKNLFVLVLFTLILNPIIAEENVLNIGLLKWGSVNWEMDIIKKNELDKKYNITIKKKFFSTKNAAAIALQGKAVDMIVTDWIWVSRQKAENKKYVFYPHSMSVGGILVKHDSEITDIKGLQNKKLL